MDTHMVPYSYLPSHYAGQPINYRIPFTMPGELILDNAAANTPFPAATFLHGIDKPFEIWSMVPKAVQGTAADPFTPVADPAPGINEFWRLRLRSTTINEDMTQNAQLVSSLVDANTQVWQWPVPYTIALAEGFTVSIDNLLSPVPGNRLRVAVSFRGYLLVLQPASETR